MSERVTYGPLRYQRRLRGTALEDQLVAILRDAGPVPVATCWIGRQLGTFDLVYSICGHNDCTKPEHLRGRKNAEYRNTDFTPRLRSLEKRGRVERITFPRPNGDPHGCAFWRLLGDTE